MGSIGMPDPVSDTDPEGRPPGQPDPDPLRVATLVRGGRAEPQSKSSSSTPTTATSSGARSPS